MFLSPILNVLGIHLCSQGGRRCCTGPRLHSYEDWKIIWDYLNDPTVILLQRLQKVVDRHDLIALNVDQILYNGKIWPYREATEDIMRSFMKPNQQRKAFIENVRATYCIPRDCLDKFYKVSILILQ